MMSIQDIFDKFEQVGCCSFSTVDASGAPVSRIAHFVAVDDGGLYFTTMTVKPYYRQLKASGKLAVCGMTGTGTVVMNEENLPVFEPGFTLRVMGDVRELTREEVFERAKGNPGFDVVVHDFEAYPETVAFVMYRGHGELYDFDFECEKRDHKLYRERFAFGGDSFVEPGLVIDPKKCIGCGACARTCTFKAVVPGDPKPYRIDGSRCDECGNCYHVCPARAVSWRS
ncbi:MAG: 4Fe-4S binding protein [Tractidigestivibacter sp.]|uniref:4Fe-4S binding protein n=1 Tax=Tractidigestivibacter sp. TaxID=2847320 RepID=UPI003D94B56D